jgi:hypothetical protein
MELSKDPLTETYLSKLPMDILNTMEKYRKEESKTNKK